MFKSSKRPASKKQGKTVQDCFKVTLKYNMNHQLNNIITLHSGVQNQDQSQESLFLVPLPF